MFKSVTAALLVGAAALVDAAHNVTVYNNDTSVVYVSAHLHPISRQLIYFMCFTGTPGKTSRLHNLMPT